VAKVRVERSINGDWQRTFVDGECVDTGHSVDWKRLLQSLGHDVEVVWGDFAGCGDPDDVFVPDIGASR